MLSPRDIEQATLDAWPALEVVSDGSWQARFANGFTKRANSIHMMDPLDDIDAGGRIERLAALYAARGLTPTYRVTPLTGLATLEAIADMGWFVYEPSLVFSMEIGPRMGFDGAAMVYRADDARFRAAQTRLNADDAEAAHTFGSILDGLEVPAAGIVLMDREGKAAASLLCVQSNGIAVFLCVVTRADLRGQGYGGRMMETGLSWAAENGARHAALQVLAQNEPAVGLYLSMGFTFRYPYHYRRPDISQ